MGWCSGLHTQDKDGKQPVPIQRTRIGWGTSARAVVMMLKGALSGLPIRDYVGRVSPVSRPPSCATYKLLCGQILHAPYIWARPRWISGWGDGFPAISEILERFGRISRKSQIELRK